MLYFLYIYFKFIIKVIKRKIIKDLKENDKWKKVNNKESNKGSVCKIRLWVGSIYLTSK